MTARHFAYLTEADPSINYGRGINEREFIRALLKLCGDDVTCIVPEPTDPRNFSDPRLEYVKPHRHQGLHYAAYLLDSWKRLLALHRERPLDALIVRLDVTPLIPYAAHRVLGLPIILKTLVNRQTFGGKVVGSFGLHDLVKRIFRSMFRTVIMEAAAADTVSGTLATGLRHEFDLGDRLHVIPNGANLELFRPGSKERARREIGMESFDHLIGYTGAITKIRYLDVLLEAFSAIETGSTIGLLIVGDGPYREQLEEECNSLGIRERVRFTGWQPYRRVPTCLRALDIGIDLSRVPLEYGGETHYATYSQKLAQYLGAGVPVLAWDLEDTAFLEEEDIGAVAAFEDVEGLTSKMERLLQGTEQGAARSERARRYAEENLAIDVLVARRMELWCRAVTMSKVTAANPSPRG